MSEEENDPGDMDNVPHVKPSIFSTRAQVKRAQKKREKLVRRAALGRADDAPRQQPLATAADAPTAMLVETSLRFGGFERHTTGIVRLPFFVGCTRSWPMNPIAELPEHAYFDLHDVVGAG